MLLFFFNGHYFSCYEYKIRTQLKCFSHDNLDSHLPLTARNIVSLQYPKLFIRTPHLLCLALLNSSFLLAWLAWPASFLIIKIFFYPSLQITNAGEGVEKREPSYTVGRNINWCSHYGKQCRGFPINKNCMIQQPHYWMYTLRKPELKETHVPQCSLQHYLQHLGHGSNLNIHQQVNG